MKCVILCGGQGTRLGELTSKIPKPLAKIGDKPILCYLMEHYAKYGINEFVLCLGYLGGKIREYFEKNPSKYKIEMKDTGETASKAQRLLKVKELVGEVFCVAYGDDLSNVNISELKKFYDSKGKIALLTAVRPENPYGIVEISESGLITGFKEKPKMNEWINGGYFIFNKKIFDYFRENEELEKEIFNNLFKANELVAYKHNGFWKSMNNLKDYQELNNMYEKGELSK